MSKKDKGKKKSELRRRIETTKTAPQMFGAMSHGFYINVQDPRKAIPPKKIEAMLHYPTIAYMAQLIIIAGNTSEWTVECDEGVPWEAVNLVQNMVDSVKFDLWRTVCYNWICFGYSAYEKVYTVYENDEGHPRIVLSALKHLLPETYSIERDADRGFLGIRTYIPRTEFLNPEKCLVLTHDKFGDDMTGNALLKNAERSFDLIQTTWENLKSFDAKASNGPKYKIRYPEQTFLDAAGNRVFTRDKANEMAQNLEDNGVALLPHSPLRAAGQTGPNESDWDIERFPTESMSSTFIDELNYLDKCLCRAFGIPERSVLEGEFSTRADAGNASEFTLMRIQYLVKQVIDQFNKYVVDKVIDLNYEDLKGRVRVVASDIDRSSVSAVREFIINLLNSNETLQKELDLDAMLDVSKFPRKQKNENKHKLVKPAYENDGEKYYDHLGRREFSFVRAQRARDEAKRMAEERK